MTRIKQRAKPVWHETPAIDLDTGRLLCVAESPAGLLLRLKGTRAIVVLPWTAAYTRACILAAAAEATHKRKRHTVRRGILAFGA